MLAPSTTPYHRDVAEFSWPRCAVISALDDVLMFDIIIRDNANSIEFITVTVAATKENIGVLTWRIDHTVNEELHTHHFRQDIVLDRRIVGSWKLSQEMHWHNVHCKSGLIARPRQVGSETTLPNRISGVVVRPRQTAFICQKPTC